MKFLTPLFDQLQTMWVSLVKALPLLSLAALLLLVTWIILRVVRRVLRSTLGKSSMRPSLANLLQTVVHTALWTLSILTALTIVFPSLTPAKLLATIGLGSVAVGFAFRDVFENFLAGALIMLRKPMRIGDFIDCGDVSGKIEQITIRDTYVRTTDGVLILVPNSYIFKNPVYVETDQSLRRYETVCGVAYGEDADNARAVILDAVESLSDIDQSKGVEIYASEFNSSSVDFTIRWWATSTPPGLHSSRDSVIRAVKRALDDRGIEIPFPYRTLTFAEPLELTGGNVKEKVDDERKVEEGQA
ncbi:mechanosensitive ion channel family protein [Congregibacter litoralis]|uniref:Small-conductance mechanosensitive channel n=1 Tax=Congregibacter litoralis KT71 TaxID=314285 RepID=A4A4U9_9GAMM|nr:mechanosensitive ion channel family protein [Congregibacter litoralis]EAQ98820.1 Small-conductance mechanosensitive channel [Congregibacter litoralis KT71]